MSDSPEFLVTGYKNSEKLAKFRKIFIKIGTKTNEFDSKIAKFPGFAIKNRKKFDNNLRIF